MDRGTMGRLLTSAALGMTGLTLVPGVAGAAPQQNDDFAGAAPFPASGATYVGTNVDATAEAGEPNHASSPYGEAFHSVWWTWTAEAAGEATISTCGSGFNTRLGVYEGSTIASLTPVASNEDSDGPHCRDTLFAETTFTATAGTTYRIAVDTSGGYPDDASGPPQGDVRIALTAPAGTPDPDPDPGTSPGVAVTEAPYTFRMPRFKVRCSQVRATRDDDCPAKATNVRFETVEDVRAWVARQRSGGADITLVESAKPSSAMDGAVSKALRSEGRGGEVLTQNLAVRRKVTTLSGSPVVLKVGYFDPAVDAQIAAATLAALDKAARKKPEVKSKCAWIATDASPAKVEDELRRLLGTGLMSQQQVGQVLRSFGCSYEVSEYFDAPGVTQDFVRGVTNVNQERDLIEIKVGLPVRQDFLLTVRDDPSVAGVDTLSIGTDGRLTVSGQDNVITIQVMERATGALIPGVDVTFLNSGGKAATQKTDASGETTFEAGIDRADRYAIMAKFTRGGATMAGYRSIDAVERTGSFVTLGGRTLTLTDGTWVGQDSEWELFRRMPAVAANLGTGISATPTSAPRLSQGSVAKPTATGLVAGQHNGVHIPDDSSFVVGAEPGHVYLGGGTPSSVAAEQRTAAAAGAFPNPFAPIGDFLNGIVTGLKRAFEQGSRAPGTVAQRVPAAQQENVRRTAEILTANGASTPPSGLISDKGLGVNACPALLRRNRRRTGGVAALTCGDATGSGPFVAIATQERGRLLP